MSECVVWYFIICGVILHFIEIEIVGLFSITIEFIQEELVVK